MSIGKKKRRVLFRRKRTLDPTILIDYKNPEILKRFITDRGKIIPRRISGATAKQQRDICQAVKRARYLSLLPYCLAHRTERNFGAEMSAIAALSMGSSRFQRGGKDKDRGGDRGAPRDRDASPEAKSNEPEKTES